MSAAFFPSPCAFNYRTTTSEKFQVGARDRVNYDLNKYACDFITRRRCFYKFITCLDNNLISGFLTIHSARNNEKHTDI